MIVGVEEGSPARDPETPIIRTLGLVTVVATVPPMFFLGKIYNFCPAETSSYDPSG